MRARSARAVSPASWPAGPWAQGQRGRCLCSRARPLRARAQFIRLRSDFIDCDLGLRWTAGAGRALVGRMREIAPLVEAYLAAERDLVAAVDAAGGAVPLPDGRTVTVGRAEHDALWGERRKRAWVTIRRNAPMPPRR